MRVLRTSAAMSLAACITALSSAPALAMFVEPETPDPVAAPEIDAAQGAAALAAIGAALILVRERRRRQT